MKHLIGLLLNLAAITATVLGSRHDMLSLSPSDYELVRYTNDSLLVQCRSTTTESQLVWRSPKGEIIKEHKGRIHIEQSAPDQLTIVFTHISLGDKGKWRCEDANGDRAEKYFELIVYQKIAFTENFTILTVKEGKDAFIRCEVKGEPQPNVTWYYNGQPIIVESFTGNTTKFQILADGLQVRKVTQNDTGEYTCRAYQVNTIASDMQERTILMKIEHKPIWRYSQHIPVQYVYPNGSVTIACEAIAEPPANFTWYKNGNKKRLHNDKHHAIEKDYYASTLTIHARNDDVFDTYRCLAENQLGAIERNTVLKRGVKPPPPSVLQLRGFNSNTFDVDVGSVRVSPARTAPSTTEQLMEVNGFRIEYMTEYEFKSDGGKWTNAKRRDFPFEDGATFLINNLEANTTYLMRAATKNLAGLSDYTKVEKFHTLSNEPKSASARLEHLTATQLLCISLVALLLCKELSFGFQPVSSITKLQRAAGVRW
ncbi:neural cell adhesion molecule 1 [Bactrocera dorsalis]|uniref:Neural cell adhesion molecule 1 n=1 Tax=Bactrocera dorsalis TaxID=27457 RepID=A0ABM3JQK4_BACDO|nr:neural cell adhesion molecule 1 [Bactrocera dorsalis]